MKTYLLTMLAFLFLALAPAGACWVDEYGTCSQCGGTGYRECNYCNGGSKQCGYCFGSGTVTVRCGTCGGSGRGGECGTCGGSGQYTTSCDGCGGTGRVVCGSCGGSAQTVCFFCGGSGQTVVRREWNAGCGVYHGESQDEKMQDKSVLVPTPPPVAVFLRPIQDDPNLNADLVSVPLGGGTQTVVLKGVRDFYPQADGSIIGSRRTSRSGHDLVLRARDGRESVVASALAFGSAAALGGQWAAFRRARLGGSWDVAVGTDGKVTYHALPDGVRPGLVAYTADGPVLEWNGAWHRPDGSVVKGFVAPWGVPVMLNKSERLEVAQEGASVQVSRVWFNGDATRVASVPGALEWFEATPDLSRVLVSVRSGDARSGWIVDLHTGRAVEVAPQAGSVVRLLSP